MNGLVRSGRKPRPHEVVMGRAIRLAQQARGRTWPNPMVGAVLVKAGRIVGQGYHRRAGLPHAEVEALRAAGAQARGATLYVNLEPCHHVGRTPPCCEAIMAAGITHVVVAMRDPNPLVNGRGLARLRRAGIRVLTGVLADEARRLNAAFTKEITTQMPWVTAKLAQSLDGKIATRTGESQWISSSVSRRLAHQLRSQVDAVMVGVKTVLRDDPRLTVRRPGGRATAKQPIRVIVDSHLRTPVSSRCLVAQPSARVVIATTQHRSRRRAGLERRGADILCFPAQGGWVPLGRVCRELRRRYHVGSILLEGGGELIASALEARLVDRLTWVIAPLIIGGRQAPAAVGGRGIRHLRQAIRLEDATWRRVGEDLVVEAAVRYPSQRRGGVRKRP